MQNSSRIPPNEARGESNGPSYSVEMESFYKGTLHNGFNVDLEQKAVYDAHLLNESIRNFIWQDVTVTVRDTKTKKQKAILDNVEGVVKAGNE